LNEESIELKRRYNALDIEVNDTHELLESKKKALEDQKEESTKLTETLKLIATSTASVEEDIRDTNSKLEVKIDKMFL
jgi:predicted  nucleic acid-binding Zn-ribbon protein